MAKTLLDFGDRVQYSVFECILDEILLDHMLKRLGKIVKEEDRVRVYSLCAKCEKEIRVIGAGAVTKDENVFIL